MLLGLIIGVLVALTVGHYVSKSKIKRLEERITLLEAVNAERDASVVVPFRRGPYAVPDTDPYRAD